jgi:uncharacterized alkaline shock family protein YloU
LTEQRNFRVEDNVVTKIAGIAVDETEGLWTTTAAPDALEGAIDQVRGDQSRPKGVTADIGGEGSRANIEVTVAVEYGKRIPQVTEAARKNVIERVEKLAGVPVNQVNITVNDVYDPEAERRRELEQQSGA